MIYCDYAATTPLDPRVQKAMLPALALWGNPSSPHAIGQEARSALEEARQSIASAFNVKIHEVILTATGSEANTLAVFGRAKHWEKAQGKPGTIITSAVEHKCTLLSSRSLKEEGWNIIELRVDEHGIIDPDELAESLTDDTALVSLQWANNETGSIQPIAEVIAICEQRGIPFHCDAVQPIGILPLPKQTPDLVTIAAHKFYGPKGIAALIVKDHVDLSPLTFGGGQEFGLRAGTENVPGAVGMAEALRLAIEEQADHQKHLAQLQKTFATEVLSWEDVALNGPEQRLPSITNLSFSGVSGETLVMQLDLKSICASTGSACTTGAADPSHVLNAMGSKGGDNVRFSFGKQTTEGDVEQVLAELRKLVES